MESPRLTAAFTTPESKRQYVSRLFDTIASRYDLITGVLSYGQDQRWKRTLISRAGLSPGMRVLDLATGTGDLAYLATARGAQAVGLDLVPRMVALARSKTPSAAAGAPVFLTGDMMALPFADAAFDVVMSGYGLRNVPVLQTACAEIARVLRPGGRFLALDFNRPESRLVRALYLGYLTVVGGALGWLLHGDADTYRYIPASLRRYPGAQGVAALLRGSGFSSVTIVPLLGGLMTLHIASRDVVEHAGHANVSPVRNRHREG
jgi:ubiquinone/menaquinone biosynthesis methyltransferase